MFVCSIEATLFGMGSNVFQKKDLAIVPPGVPKNVVRFDSSKRTLQRLSELEMAQYLCSKCVTSVACRSERANLKMLRIF